MQDAETIRRGDTEKPKLSTQQRLFWLFLFLALALFAFHVIAERIVFVVHVRGLLFDSSEPALQAPARPGRFGFSGFSGPAVLSERGGVTAPAPALSLARGPESISVEAAS